MAEELYVNDKVEDFQYEIQSDGTVRIEKYLGKGGTVIFPSEIEGYPVTALGYETTGWFIHNELVGAEDPVKKIIIPEGIKRIEENAFSGFTNVGEISLPNSLEYIGEKAFYGMPGLKEITIPENVSFVGKRAFASSRSLKDVHVYGSVVGEHMFSGCNYIENIYISGNVKTIGKYAFAYTTSVKKIIIEEGVEEIGDGAFYFTYADYIIVPESVKRIGYGTFSNPSRGKNAEKPMAHLSVILKNPNVVFMEDKPVDTDFFEPEINHETFYISQKYAKFSIYSFHGTKVQTYALNNGIDFTQIAKVEVNGQEVKTDVPPIVKNNRVLMPMRAIFESLGATVDWNGETQTITANTTTKNIVLPLNSNTMTVNNEVKTLDVGTEVIMERTLVPVRAVSESIGADVKWDAERQTVVVTY